MSFAHRSGLQVAPDQALLLCCLLTENQILGMAGGAGIKEQVGSSRLCPQPKTLGAGIAGQGCQLNLYLFSFEDLWYWKCLLCAGLLQFGTLEKLGSGQEILPEKQCQLV